jgi:IS4 transposase
VHAVDSTTIELVASCMDWAKHRRRKAAAKCHTRLNLQSFLPSFAIVDTAREHDAKRAREVCAGVSAGEIVVFDKAYVDFEHLKDLNDRGVSWVTRAKDNLAVEVYRRLPLKRGSKVLRDEIVRLTHQRAGDPEYIRRVVALVEVDGEEREMTFLTNNLEWSPQTVVDLYGSRWGIEAFFKQLKQTLQLADFLGHNANAVRWQVWIALLVYVLLRFQAFLSQWGHSFTRLFTLTRASLWKKLDHLSLLRSYGTAGGQWRMMATPDQAYLPGFG